MRSVAWKFHKICMNNVEALNFGTPDDCLAVPLASAHIFSSNVIYNEE